MRRIVLAGLLAAGLTGCIDWQGGYDSAARRECARNPDGQAMRACLDSVEANAHAKREAGRN